MTLIGSNHRRGQVEMVGLVIIVAIIIIGIVLYLAFSNRGGSTKANTANMLQGHSSYLLAFLETKVPGCGISVQEVAAACSERDTSVCVSGMPCVELKNAMDDITNATFRRYGEKFNLRLQDAEGNELAKAEFSCDVNNPKTLTYPSAGEPIATMGGSQTMMLLTLCR